MDEILLFIKELENCSTKSEIGLCALKCISSMLSATFSSYISKEESTLRVTCQMGDNTAGKKIFNKEMSEQIYDWVIEQNEIASLKLGDNQNFVFVPLIHNEKEKVVEHGILVLSLSNSKHEITEKVNSKIKIIGKLTCLALSKSLVGFHGDKYERLQEQINLELNLTSKIQKSISGVKENKKIRFSVLEDESSNFNGNLYWINDLGGNITLVLIAQIHCKGSPAALLTGYILGEMNSLKTRAEISLNPKEVLKHLNLELNNVFKDTSVSVNAWYGVFNLDARKVRFANANHPDPFLIGPEQQVTNLSSSDKGEPLGLNVNSLYSEGNSYISTGSKLVIFTKDLLEKAANIGEKYDPTWLPQVLETIGTLPLSEMRNSLASILSESATGTAHKGSRLALLLEISQ